MAKKQVIDVASHALVPKHALLSEKEKKALFEKYHISVAGLPKIFANDPAVAALGAKPGDVVKVTRVSPTAGETVYYRGVISE